MGRRKITADLFFSVDIEADGPIPGPYSMLAIGLCVAGRFDGERYERRDPEAQTLYLELKPSGNLVDSDALQVSGLDRARLMEEGEAPEEAMAKVSLWLERTCGEDRAVICAYPAAFDWLFLYWYLQRFAPQSTILDFSSCIDMKTMYATKAGVTFDRAGLSDLPMELQSSRKHTHNALDDAREQAEIFSALFEWTP